MWVDASEIITAALEKEIDFGKSLSKEDTVTDERETKEIVCIICGTIFESLSFTKQICPEESCKAYNTVIRNSKTPARMRVKEMVHLYETGLDYDEINALGLGNSSGNVKTCIEKFYKTDARNQKIIKSVENRRRVSGYYERMGHDGKPKDV